MGGGGGDQADRLAFVAHGEEAQAARAGMADGAVAPLLIRPDYRRAVSLHHLVEQAHLGGEIVLHIGVIIEVIAREIGESARRHRHAFLPILRQAVARRLEGDMAHPLAGKAGEIGEEGDDIGGGEAGVGGFSLGGDAPSDYTKRADRGGADAGAVPELAGHLHGGGLAVGAGDGNDHLGHRGEEARGEMGEGAAGLGVR